MKSEECARFISLNQTCSALNKYIRNPSLQFCGKFLKNIQKKKKIEIKCIVCQKTIEQAPPGRKYCRGIECRKLFYRLKKLYNKGQSEKVPEDKKELYNRLCKDNEFESANRPRKDDYPFKNNKFTY